MRTAFYGEGFDSNTGLPVAGVSSNRGNHLGTVADTDDTFRGAQIFSFLDPLILNHNVYLGLMAGQSGAAVSWADHQLSRIAVDAATWEQAKAGGTTFRWPTTPPGNSIGSLVGTGGIGQDIVKVGDTLGGGQVVSLGDFDFNSAARGSLRRGDQRQ